jgi:hypothetical protein
MSAIAVLAMTGLAIDLGRMYVAKNEAQTYADIAAIDAALELDGELTGFVEARDAVAASTNMWNFGHNTFANSTVEFSQSDAGPWEANPATGTNYRFVRVSTSVDVPVTFIRAVAAGSTRDVAARAVAGQRELTSLSEGACPFAPLAHSPTLMPHFGLTPGEKYTLRWPSAPDLDKKAKKQPCGGDQSQSMIDLSQSGGSQYRGFIITNSASDLSSIVMYDRQETTLNVGDTVDATEGGSTSVRTAIQDRVNSDTDSNAQSYASYRGNGRRIISCPVTYWVAPGAYKIVGFRKFFLQPANDYSPNDGEAWCAEYIPEATVQGNPTQDGAGDPGYYVVRLSR